MSSQAYNLSTIFLKKSHVKSLLISKHGHGVNIFSSQDYTSGPVSADFFGNRFSFEDSIWQERRLAGILTAAWWSRPTLN